MVKRSTYEWDEPAGVAVAKPTKHPLADDPAPPVAAKEQPVRLSAEDAAAVHDALVKLGRIAEQYNHHWSEELQALHRRAVDAVHKEK